MNRVLRAVTVVLLFELGALLLYLPWSAFWEQNYFLNHLPWLTTVVLHPATRGLVSGIGVLDMLVGFGAFSPRPAAMPATPQSNS
jgi:hypothetical protein